MLNYLSNREAKALRMVRCGKPISYVETCALEKQGLISVDRKSENGSLFFSHLTENGLRYLDKCKSEWRKLVLSYTLSIIAILISLTSLLVQILK